MTGAAAALPEPSSSRSSAARALGRRPAPQPVPDDEARAAETSELDGAHEAIKRLLTRFRCVMGEGGTVVERVVVPVDDGNSSLLVDAGYRPPPTNIGLTRSGLADDLRRRSYYSGRSANGSYVKEVLDNYYAIVEPEPCDTWIRVAPWTTEQGGRAIVVDLAIAGRGDCLAITAEGIERLSEPPVVFVRTDDVAAMVEPDLEHPATIEELHTHFNLDDDGFGIVLAWICMAHDPTIAHPLLLVEGPSGSGKTYVQAQAAMLVDNDRTQGRTDVIRGTPEDLMSVAHTRYVLSPDNLSKIDRARSDTLCRISTGVTAATRVLGKTAGTENARLRLHRPVVLSSTGLSGQGSDLENRMIRVEARRVHKLVAEDTQSARFQAARPRLYARVLLTVHEALGHMEDAEANFDKLNAERMGGATKWLYAVGKVLGQDLVGAYHSRLRDGQRAVLENQPFLHALTDHVAAHGGYLAASASELLAAVTPADPPHRWPQSAAGAGRAIQRNQDMFRRLGWNVSFLKAERKWEFQRADPD